MLGDWAITHGTYNWRKCGTNHIRFDNPSLKMEKMVWVAHSVFLVHFVLIFLSGQRPTAHILAQTQVCLASVTLTLSSK